MKINPSKLIRKQHEHARTHTRARTCPGAHPLQHPTPPHTDRPPPAFAAHLWQAHGHGGAPVAALHLLILSQREAALVAQLLDGLKVRRGRRGGAEEAGAEG